MREIKFRAWDGEDIITDAIRAEWIEPREVVGMMIAGHYRMGVNMCTPVVLEQITGLLDKNDTPIYEGDIVQPYLSGVKIEAVAVSYENHGFTMDGVWYLDVEVIGNIHENPELLK